MLVLTCFSPSLLAVSDFLRTMAKAIENGQAQGAPATQKKNWLEKDLKDDLSYLVMCVQQGEENVLKKVKQRTEYDTDPKRCSSEEEKACLEQEFAQEVKEIKERSKTCSLIGIVGSRL